MFQSLFKFKDKDPEKLLEIKSFRSPVFCMIYSKVVIYIFLKQTEDDLLNPEIDNSTLLFFKDVTEHPIGRNFLEIF